MVSWILGCFMMPHLLVLNILLGLCLSPTHNDLFSHTPCFLKAPLTVEACAGDDLRACSPCPCLLDGDVLQALQWFHGS